MAPYACAQFRLPHIFPLRSLAAAPMAALLAGAALLWLLPTAAAHGMLAEPAARNVARNWQHCPHCVNGGGPYETSDHGRLRWPRTTQPVRWAARAAGLQRRCLMRLALGRGSICRPCPTHTR